MSWGHDDGKDDKAKSGGGGIDMGISSMIGGFFGIASGAEALKSTLKWGWGHDDHH